MGKNYKVMDGGSMRSLVIVFLLLLFFNFSFAKEIKEKKVELKEIQGKVTWIGRDKIAITYYTTPTTEEEILIFYDKKDIKIRHRKDISEISRGDIVSIVYEEIREDTDEGEKLTFKAKEIIYIRKGS